LWNQALFLDCHSFIHPLLKLLDRETAGLIWAGRITRWDDPVIKELNPQLASKLPAEPILLGITPDFSIVATALSKFSPEFVSAFESANRSLAHMPPALSGHASLIRSILSERVEWLKAPNLLPNLFEQQMCF